MGGDRGGGYHDEDYYGNRGGQRRRRERGYRCRCNCNNNSNNNKKQKSRNNNRKKKLYCYYNNTKLLCEGYIGCCETCNDSLYSMCDLHANIHKCLCPNNKYKSLGVRPHDFVAFRTSETKIRIGQ